MEWNGIHSAQGWPREWESGSFWSLLMCNHSIYPYEIENLISLWAEIDNVIYAAYIEIYIESGAEF
jgi:hypothetical protein